MGEKSIFRQISLIQTEDAKRYEMDKFFGCPISFSQNFDGFILHINDFYKPNKNFNTKRYQRLLKNITQHTVIFSQNKKFSSVIKGTILQLLSTEDLSLNSVAESIKVSPRAIRKRLEKENVTFKTLVSDVRMNIAKRLLIQSDIPLIRVSEMLGYSEPSAFSRAFRSIHKCSPRAWRKEKLMQKL